MLCLDTGDALERSSCATNHELEACTKLFRLGEKRLVAPDALPRSVFCCVLVASSVPPSANAADHLGDTLVGQGAVVAHHLGQAWLVGSGLAFALLGLAVRASGGACHRHAHTRCLDCGETNLTKQAHNEICGGPKAGIRSLLIDSLLEMANGSSTPIAHVVEVNIENGQLDETARLQHAASFRENAAVVSFGCCDGESVHNSSEALRGKGELVEMRVVLDLVMVRGTEWEA